jgi:hypothetical protein
MKLGKLIKELQALKKEVGDVQVVLSSDSEGNSWGTLHEKHSFCRLENENGMIVGLGIFPYADGFYDEYEALHESLKNK